jgi:enoyl-CoA hydratase
MEFKNLLFEVKDGIVVLTINRPRQLNALNSETWDEVSRAFAEIAADKETRVVIVTGAGRAFAAGVDITEIMDLTPEGMASNSRMVHQTIDQIENSSKPVIAAINGMALGGGLELAMSCHIRVASETAIHGLPEVGLGSSPSGGGTQRLPRLIGKGPALYYILTGENITAQEAYRLGLVNVVVPLDKLMPACFAVARVIAQKGPIGIKLALTAVIKGLEVDLAKGLELEEELAKEWTRSEDFKEGIKSFMERRAPVFKGR